MTFKRTCRFAEVKEIIEGEIYDQEGDLEVSTALLGLFAFTDRAGIEFALRILRNEQADLSTVLDSIFQMLR